MPSQQLDNGDQWLAFVANLPTDDPSARMRILRTLEALGAGILRDGVYMLPDSPQNRSSLSSLSEHVTRLNGMAHVLRVTSPDSQQRSTFQALFDRKKLYQDLKKDIESLTSGMGKIDPASIAAVLSKKRKELESIERMDFFPGPEREAVTQSLEKLGRDLKELIFPLASKGTTTNSVHRRFVDRTWATRTPLGIDRLASAWLIRRHIDPNAQILCLDREQRCPASAVSFGYDGAQFFNTRTQVTFEVLLAHFGLASDSSLGKMAALVKSIQDGNTSISEAAGVEKLIEGARRRTTQSEDLVAECEKTFDLLWQAYTEPADHRA